MLWSLDFDSCQLQPLPPPAPLLCCPATPKQVESIRVPAADLDALKRRAEDARRAAQAAEGAKDASRSEIQRLQAIAQEAEAEMQSKWSALNTAQGEEG